MGLVDPPRIFPLYLVFIGGKTSSHRVYTGSFGGSDSIGVSTGFGSGLGVGLENVHLSERCCSHGMM